MLCMKSLFSADISCGGVMHKIPQLYRSSVVSVSVTLPLQGCQKSNLSGVIGVIGVISVIGAISVIASQIARFFSHSAQQGLHK